MWNRKPKSKYGARRTNCLAKKHPHGSALEASVCDLLSAREQANEISEVKWIATVRLTKTVTWKVDFAATDNKTGKRFWIEAKGKEMADYRIKKKLWAEGFGPGKLEIWKGDWKRPKLAETILPNVVDMAAGAGEE